IQSAVGVRIESHHKSHVKMALLSEPVYGNNSEFRLSFEFNTTSADGILFYGRNRNPQEMIALVLENGDLMYKIRCSTVYADILVPTQNNSLLNDSTWHTISYSIEYGSYSSQGRLELDGRLDSRVGRYSFSCANLTRLIMGGHRERDIGNIHGLENLPGHFEGCIRNAFVTNAQAHPPKYSFVSICE
ncbi:unnamed protein product, partial [Candidula unifasciata]